MAEKTTPTANGITLDEAQTVIAAALIAARSALNPKDPKQVADLLAYLRSVQ